MQPSTADGYKPKWRHFHPQSTVWVQNPLSHDVVFQVADEHNNPYQYKLPQNKTSELPGGAVATLGVKAIVDELIQNDKNDVLRIWDEQVRSKYEEQVILRIKEASVRPQASGPVGEIDLSVTASDEAPDDVPESTEETAFPDLNPTTTPADTQVSNIAAASLGTSDTIIEE